MYILSKYAVNYGLFISFRVRVTDLRTIDQLGKFCLNNGKNSIVIKKFIYEYS